MVETAAGKVAMITPAGSVTEYNLPTSRSGPYGIATGPADTLWITENSADKIAAFAADDPMFGGAAAPGASGKSASIAPAAATLPRRPAPATIAALPGGPRRVARPSRSPAAAHGVSGPPGFLVAHGRGLALQGAPKRPRSSSGPIPG